MPWDPVGMMKGESARIMAGLNHAQRTARLQARKELQQAVGEGEAALSAALDAMKAKMNGGQANKSAVGDMHVPARARARTQQAGTRARSRHAGCAPARQR